MTVARTRWVLVGLLCVAVWLAYAAAQGGRWARLNAAGIEAYQRGDFAEAETQIAAARKVAEGFGPEDPRLATTLDALGALFRARHGGKKPAP